MPRSLLLGWGSASDGQLGPAQVELHPTPRPFAGLPSAAAPTAFAAGLWTSVIATHDGAAVFTTTPTATTAATAAAAAAVATAPSPSSSFSSSSSSSFSSSTFSPTYAPAPDAHRPASLALIPGTSVPPHPPDLPPFVAVAAGRDFALLLSAAGALYSVGAGAYGQLGRGTDVVSLVYPERVHALADVRVVAVAAAEFHWLALDAGGRVFACGANATGQLGLMHKSRVTTPQVVTAVWPHAVVDVATGDAHSAVLTAGGAVLVFGSNKHGQLGRAEFRVQVASLAPVRVEVEEGAVQNGRVAAASVRRDADGDVAMEAATAHQEGSDCKNDKDEGDKVDCYVDVACGESHTVALRSDGRLACWGKGENGQLGTRTTQTLYSPAVISLPANFVSVSAGAKHSAAVTDEGVAYVWGDGSLGQIGDGDMNDKFLPVALPAPRVNGSRFMPWAKEVVNGSMAEESEHPYRFLQLACGGYHTLGLVSNDPAAAVYCAERAHASRIPRCVVDDMLGPQAGLLRFGSAQVLLRTFVRRNAHPYSRRKLDFEGAHAAYEAYLQLFGDAGRKRLAYAAARIRHEAQIAFRLAKEDGPSFPFSAEHYTDDAMDPPRLVTPRSKLINDENLFRSSVANFRECGYLFMLAMLNPVYTDRRRVSDLAELAGILLRCEDDAREAFLEMVSHCPQELLITRLIRPLQRMLTEDLRFYGRVRKSAKFATKALALCYHGVCRASKRRKLRELIIPRKEFYNETVSERMDLREDYERWSESQGDALPKNLSDLPPLPVAGQDEGLFSFCTYSFLLSEAAKFQILEMESTHTMNKESMRSVLSFSTLPMPMGPFGRVSHMRLPPEQIAHLQYLVLNVRRDHIVSDAFQQVAEVAQKYPRGLHKPLKVIFDGEDGVDEGGVRKEFYQVLMEEVLSADYGMFEYDEETRFHWFRKDSLESEQSWTLIGTMFGLAAFNSILLDVQFPHVVYRKLQVALRQQLLALRNDDKSLLEASESYKADLDDVKETFPSIGNSLEQILTYDGDDVEDVFCLTFEISYQGLFGKVITVELIPDGANIPVTNQNREQFVSVYVEYLINRSIDSAFKHFALGFSLMLNGPFVRMFGANELETLIVGEKELDFEALRAVAKYEGYTEESAVVQHLWQVLTEFNIDMKRLFLSFVTGTDRAPIGGLRKLVLLIQRAEGDSNRLPTSHTCFNVLLLPEYGTRAKLRDRLSTAIRNSKGFGLR